MIWLKANDPKYFGDIVIDDDLLNKLQDDNIPDEIVALVPQSEEAVKAEEGGYVTSSFVDDIDSHFDDTDHRKFRYH